MQVLKKPVAASKRSAGLRCDNGAPFLTLTGWGISVSRQLTSAIVQTDGVNNSRTLQLASCPLNFAFVQVVVSTSFKKPLAHCPVV
jgi:hypothetical protein